MEAWEGRKEKEEWEGRKEKEERKRVYIYE